ncbi:hypothetical protein BC830DRAFT_1144327 [Chytriomyces sp. MP71]|nr:hypothetical protein BC830DRAFT_1144327 [Chytriomyces sp. MP71]
MTCQSPKAPTRHFLVFPLILTSPLSFGGYIVKFTFRSGVATPKTFDKLVLTGMYRHPKTLFSSPKADKINAKSQA